MDPEASQVPIRWAPRVAPSKIRRLYAADARGLVDVDLIDDVGFTLQARCVSFLAAEEARAGRALCHACGASIGHGGRPEEVLHCAKCGWEVTWRVYFRSLQHKQLSGPDLIATFRVYVAAFPRASSPRERMLLIDQLLHAFHWSAATGPRRPSAVNLIEGRLSEVIALLDNLSYGEGSTDGVRDRRARWRREMNTALKSWGQPELRSEE